MSFFGTVEKVKCKKCPIGTPRKQKDILRKEEDPWSRQSDKSRILVITEHPPSFGEIKAIETLFGRHHDLIDIIAGIECIPMTAKAISSPIHKTYKNCDTCSDVNYSKYSSIITFGRALYAITRSDDIMHWLDFTETEFNQQYLFTNINEKKAIRVYPCAPLSDISDISTGTLFDNFNKWHSFQQIYRSLDHMKFGEEKYEEIIPWTYSISEDPNIFLKENMGKECAWDLEVSSKEQVVSLQWKHPSSRIICMTLTFDGNHSYYLPFELISLKVLRKFFDTMKLSITSGGKYDKEILENIAQIPDIPLHRDTALAFKILNTDRKLNGAKSIAWLIPGMGGYENDLDEYRKQYKINDFRDIPQSKLIPYACGDAILAWRANKLADKLGKLQENAYRQYLDIMMPAIPAFSNMKVNGILIDVPRLETTFKDITEKLENAKIKLKEALDTPHLDPDKARELTEAFQRNGLPCLGYNLDKITWTISERELYIWKRDGYIAAEYLEKYREYKILQSTFLGDPNKLDEEVNVSELSLFENIADAEQPERKFQKKKGITALLRDNSDGSKSLHPDIGVGRANSGRVTHQNPNSGNWPKHGEQARLINSIQYCEKGWWNSEFDYSGFQMRLVAIESQEPTLLKLLRSNGDPHSATAQFIFTPEVSLEQFLKLKKEEPYKTYRNRGKVCNFSLLFRAHFSILFKDIDPWGIERHIEYCEKNNINPDDLKGNEGRNTRDRRVFAICQDVHTKFFQLYSGLIRWSQRQAELGRIQGYIDSIAGGRRHIPQMRYMGRDFDRKIYDNLDRILVNSPAQNSEALLIYEATRKANEEFKKRKLKAKFFNFIHDADRLRHPKEETLEVSHIMQSCMYIPETRWGMPFEVSGDTGIIPGFGIDHSPETLPRLNNGFIYRADWVEEGKNKSKEYCGYNEDDFRDVAQIPDHAEVVLLH